VKTFKSGFVSIIGRTNVGKSTLLNRLVGEKIAIISDKPQTTRNQIMGIKTLPYAQMVFLDTPGIHKPKHELNRRMVKIALRALQNIDLILLMIAADKAFGTGDQFVLDLLKDIKTIVFLLINKIDLIKKKKILPLIDKYHQQHDFAEIIPLSALLGDNSELLEEKIIQFLPVGPKYFPEDHITDQPERTLVAEIIREKIINLTLQELPYSTAVIIESFKEDLEKKLLNIRATIYVDKPSQKGIIIGKSGSMLKNIGTLARLDMEKILSTKVYLELWIKVKRKWRENNRILRLIGLAE
jgi:GTP-binding protein Era